MTEFEISPEEDVQDASQGGEVADFSPLAALRKRREELVNDLYIDIQVPRWSDPEIYVRFKPVSAVKLNSAIDRRRKSKSDDWSLLANADMLIDSCLGIYAQVGDQKYSLRVGDPTGNWTKFDPDLAAALGINALRATDTVVALYFTEGDLIDAANKLFKWSGIASDEADESF